MDSIQIRIVKFDRAESEVSVRGGLAERRYEILQETIGAPNQISVRYIPVDMKVS